MAQTDAHSLKDSKNADLGARGERAASDGSASQQEKTAINAGLTGDKVAHNDIATSPLGTDDEAGGGHPVGGELPKRAAPSDNTARDPNRSNERSPPMPWIWVVVALLVAALLGVGLMSALG